MVRDNFNEQCILDRGERPVHYGKTRTSFLAYSITRWLRFLFDAVRCKTIALRNAGSVLNRICGITNDEPHLHPKFSNFGALPAAMAPGNLKLVRELSVMRKGYRLIAVVVVSLASLVTMHGASAQANSERKVALRVAPVYPELAKKMHIRGVVKLEAIVRPNGTVRSTRALGGNPVLVQAALDAVGKWKFDPAQGETTEAVQLTFENQ